jgi:hypothetical protein
MTLLYRWAALLVLSRLSELQLRLQRFCRHWIVVSSEVVQRLLWAEAVARVYGIEMAQLRCSKHSLHSSQALLHSLRPAAGPR